MSAVRRCATVLAILAACDREHRPLQVPAASSPLPIATQHLRPGELYPPNPGAAYRDTAAHYDHGETAWAVSEGKRLYTLWNCVGCHAAGGGSIGPALMDDRWRYGGTPRDIYESITQGRPGGMPAFGGRATDDQVRQLTAYVLAMGGRLRADVRSGRDDHMQVRIQDQALRRQPVRTSP